MKTVTNDLVPGDSDDKDPIVRFGRAFHRGLEAIEEASRIFVETIDVDKTAAEAFAKAYPEIPPSAWAGFEAVGRGWLDRRVPSMGGVLGYSLRRLPKSQQTKVLDEGVELLTPSGETLTTSVHSLTPKQVKQVFCDHIRSLGEQKAWMIGEGMTNAASPCLRTEPYVIAGGRLRVREACDIGRKELARIMYELER